MIWKRGPGRGWIGFALTIPRPVAPVSCPFPGSGATPTPLVAHSDVTAITKATSVTAASNAANTGCRYLITLGNEALWITDGQIDIATATDTLAPGAAVLVAWVASCQRLTLSSPFGRTPLPSVDK